MAAALAAAPTGNCVCWGIPFEIGEAVLLADRPVTVEIALALGALAGLYAHLRHAPGAAGAGGIISPMRGEGQLAEHAADYVICYADGSEERAAIRRRRQIGAFQRRWGENCFAGRRAAQAPPAAARATSSRSRARTWGWRQTRVAACGRWRRG